MADFPTPHINATPDDFAKTVIMPGDPLRSKYIAETFLTDARLVNNVRGVQGYTGLYKGKSVSVMASGMGMPSIGIYAYELYQYFGVERIIRAGSAGGIQPQVNVRDVIFGLGACTDSNFARQYDLNGTFSPVCSYELLKIGTQIADEQRIRYHVGNLLSSDVFYNDSFKTADVWGKMGVLAVEMEAAALYMTAARAKRQALAICTVSDHLITGECTTADERQNSFNEMIKLALEISTK